MSFSKVCDIFAKRVFLVSILKFTQNEIHVFSQIIPYSHQIIPYSHLTRSRWETPFLRAVAQKFMSSEEIFCQKWVTWLPVLLFTHDDKKKKHIVVVNGPSLMILTHCFAFLVLVSLCFFHFIFVLFFHNGGTFFCVGRFSPNQPVEPIT